MADETTPDGSSSSGRPGDDTAKAKTPARPAFTFGDVVSFTHHDPILGHAHSGVGVVEDVDDQGLTVAPLAHHSIRVALADAEHYAGES